MKAFFYYEDKEKRIVERKNVKNIFEKPLDIFRGYDIMLADKGLEC